MPGIVLRNGKMMMNVVVLVPILMALNSLKCHLGLNIQVMFENFLKDFI